MKLCWSYTCSACHRNGDMVYGNDSKAGILCFCQSLSCPSSLPLKAICMLMMKMMTRTMTRATMTTTATSTMSVSVTAGPLCLVFRDFRRVRVLYLAFSWQNSKWGGLFLCRESRLAAYVLGSSCVSWYTVHVVRHDLLRWVTGSRSSNKSKWVRNLSTLSTVLLKCFGSHQNRRN